MGNILQNSLDVTYEDFLTQIPIRGHAVDFVAVLPPKWK